MGRPRKPLTPGRIEHFARRFDPALDVADLAGERFKNLREGDWGIRYYQVGALEPGARAVFIMGRVSDDVGTVGQRAPFANQIEDIAKAAQQRGQRLVAAVYWDCETGGDFKRKGGSARRVQRQGFLSCCRDALAYRAAPCEIWTWDTKRLTRGFGVLPLLEELESAGVKLFTRQGRVQRDMLPLEIMFAKREREDIAARTARGRRAMAERIGVAPTKRIPVGWKAQGTADDKRWRTVHDPEAMPAWQEALTGMRFHAWSWRDAADHLNTRRVLRLADRDQTAEAGAIARPWHAGLVRASLHKHTWWFGEGSWRVPQFFYDDDGDATPAGTERIVFQVPPAVVDDPEQGPRRFTREDLAAIDAVAFRARPGQRAGRSDSTRPLVGILRCAECGRAMQAVQAGPATKAGVRHWYYRCPTATAMRLMGHQPCNRRPYALREARLIADIWAKLIAALSDPKLLTARYRAEIATLEEQLGAQQHEWRLAEIKRLTTAEAKLLVQQALADGDAAAALNEAIKLLRAERAGHQQLVEDADEAYAQLEQSRARLVQAEAVAQQIDTQDLGKVLPRFSTSGQMAFIQSAVETVYVSQCYVTRSHVKKLDQECTDLDKLRLEVHFLGLPLDQFKQLATNEETPENLVSADFDSASR